MADVFISYSRPDRDTAASLAEELIRGGASVWWDRELLPADSYHELIPAEIAASRAAIVLWTEHSVRSQWVLSEARRAHSARKLVPLRSADLDADRIPPPYDILQIGLISDRSAIASALRRLGVDISLAPTEAAPKHERRSARFRRVSIATGVVLVSAIVTGLGWRGTRPPAPVVWAELPAGFSIVNMTPASVVSYLSPDRTSDRGPDLRSGQVVPAAGLPDPIWRATVGRDAWLRFPAGEGRFGHVLESEVRLRPPR